MESNKVFLVFGLLFFLALIPMVSAWGPGGHTYLANQVFENVDSKIIKDCLPYKDAFMLGSMTPDITVIFYYSQGGADYQLTHNWNFQEEVMSRAQTPDEVCFAYGIGAHLIADTISHNIAVPSAIEESKIPNWLIHPLLEQKYDASLFNRYEGLKNESEHVMDALYGEKGDRYVELVENALGENVDFDVKSEMTKLAISLNGFYDETYKPRGETFIFKAYPAIAKLTIWLQPIFGDSNSGDVDFAFEKAEELMTESYNNWGARYQLSPHGFESLKSANQSANAFNFIYILLMLLPSAILIYKTKKWRWAFLIPAMLLLEIVFVYIFLI